jgi:hypothetical protein
MFFGEKDFKVQTLVFPTVKAPKENPKREKGKETHRRCRHSAPPSPAALVPLDPGAYR